MPENEPPSNRVPQQRKTGIYSFVWDNTASLVTNKHISFRAGTLTFT